MTRHEMIDFIKANHYVKITHTLFDPHEFIYSEENGEVYDENGFLFEDWDNFSPYIGIRMRIGAPWESGWEAKEKVTNTICKHLFEIPTVGLCCEAYYKARNGWMHFPYCSPASCPLKNPKLLKGNRLED